MAGRNSDSGGAGGADGTIYFGSRDNNMYAVTADGALMWSYATGDYVESSAAIAGDGRVCAGSWDHFLYAFCD